ncbi:MAG TPA: N-acetylmuramoyl-L-alanine amidase [Oryzihumus sp.]|nr:N-acetylmuramoyl-L-alanine amidase [Oryzihumus sp.]
MARLSKRKTILGAGLVAAVVTGCLTAVASPGRDAAATSWAPVRGPVHADVEQVALSATPGTSRVDVPQRATKPFSLLGVTWDQARARLDGSVEVRVRSATSGQWSGWYTVNPQGEDAPDRAEGARARGGTAPLWVGPSNGVQLRVAGRPSRQLPAGMKLALVDPGHAGAAHVANMAYVQDVSPTDTSMLSTSTAPPTTSTDSSTSSTTTDQSASTSSSATTTDTFTSSTTTGAASPTSTSRISQGLTSPSATTTTTAPPMSAAPMPPIATRADWGADESKRRTASPDYGDSVQVVFVHHTVGANDYTCGPGSNGADGPNGSKAVIRSIYAYHVDPAGQNFDDIGYNFLVDKCGQLWEGRYGGMDQPVIGAQTYGFNTDSAGIAVLGTYTDAGASAAAEQSIARLAAWKLGFAKISPDKPGQVLTYRGDTAPKPPQTPRFVQGNTYSFHAISGHRDGFSTECPGQALYDQLPTIRTWAAGPPSGVRITGISGATAVSGTYYTRGAVTVSWTATSPLPLVTRSDLLVDGVAAATSTTGSTSLKATLTPGRHTVAVRATQFTGKPATSAASTVVGDTTAPTFPTKPYAGLRGGTVASTSAPMTLVWKAADNALLRQVQATAPSAATFAPTTTSWATAARPGVSTTFALKATDAAGNTGTASTVVTPAILQETSAVRTGSWTSRNSSSYLGGYSLSTSALNASLTWKFTGRSVAWVVSRASSSGQAAIYVDGVKVATVDLRSSTTLYRNAIWTRTWSTSATHTVKVVNLATAGRPTITTDGIVYLK